MTASTQLRLAYLTNQYPAVSHTFIRREILALERLGHAVHRVSIRPPATALVDPADLAEQQQTLCCLDQPARALAAAVASEAFTRPARFSRALFQAIAWGRSSPAGVRKHLAYLAEAAFLRRDFARRDIQHVHAHFGTNPATVARLIHALGGPGYSFTVHGPDELDDPRGHHLAGKTADARFVVAISDYTRSQLMRWTDPALWPRFHVVRCTVDELPPLPPPPAAGPARFLNIGRLSAQKGQLVLIEAMALAAQAGHDFTLTIIGDGELRPAIEAAIRHHGLADRVHLTGSLPGPAVRDHLAQATALVLPSSAEGLPVVIMEAFASTTPVISTWVAGIPELVEHDRSGLLVPPARPDLLLDAMARMAALTPDRRRAMGEAGRAAVEQRHTPDTQAPRLADLFQTAMRDPA